MKYCKHCGSQLNNGQKCVCPDSVVHRERTQKGIIKYGIIGGIVCLAAIVIIIITSTILSTSTLNAFDYVEVTYTGYDSNGKANIKFDIDSIINNLIGDEPDIENQKEYSKWLVKQEAYYDAIDYSYEPQNGLSNGDIVAVTITVSDILNGKVTGGSKTYTVFGLATIETIDVFSNINVEFEGISGEARADIVYKTDLNYLKEYSFDITPRSGLSSGDIVTVNIKGTDEIAEEYHVFPAEITKEFVVPSLETYVTSPDQISKKGLEDIMVQFIEQTQNNNKDDSIFSYGKVAYYGTYLLIPHEETITSTENELRIYVSYDKYKRGEYWETVYTSLDFEDVTISADGAFELNIDEGNVTGFVNDLDSYIEELKNEYHVHTIDKTISIK